jgi:hypothetical protein
MGEPKGRDDKKSETMSEPPRPDHKKLEVSDEKRAEIIASLRDRAWVSFDERRRHEYRISLTFWAIYLGTIGFVLKLEGSLKFETKWVLSGTMIFLAVGYLYWNFHLAKTQQLDRTMAIYYGELLLEACGIQWREVYEYLRIGKKSPVMDSTHPKLRVPEYVRNWNHLSEAAATIILAAASVLVIYLK